MKWSVNWFLICMKIKESIFGYVERERKEYI